MLEERDFDLLIPQAPFHRFPQKIKHLLNLCEIPIISEESLEITSSNTNFINYMIEVFPEFGMYFDNKIEQNNLEKYRNGVYISDTSVSLLKDKEKSEPISKTDLEGFFLPLTNIYCIGFFSTSNSIKIMGLQKVKPPENHDFINDSLEMNSYYPCNEIRSKRKYLSVLTNIVRKLNLVGFNTLFFGIYKEEIIPFACVSLPDEKIDLWTNLLNSKITSFFLKGIKNSSTDSINPIYGFKIPFYSSQTIEVPTIPQKLATQRNLPGILSHNNHPVCAIVGTSNSYQEVEEDIIKKKSSLNRILKNPNL